MTDTEYFAHPAISREDLLLLADSPELFHTLKSGGIDAEEARKVMDELDPPSKKLDNFGLGDATHRLIFQPETVEERFVVAPASVLAKNGARTGTAWKRYKAECDAEGRIPIKEGQLALARMVAAAAKKTLGPLLVPTAIHERPIFWKETVIVDGVAYEVEFRGKPDYLLVDEAKKIGVIIDLKTCPTVSEFVHNLRRFRYWMQFAHYRAGFKAIYGFYPRCYFAAAGKKLPFRCRLFQLDDDTEQKADLRRTELIEEYVRRRETNDWSDPDQSGIETVNVQVA